MPAKLQYVYVYRAFGYATAAPDQITVDDGAGSTHDILASKSAMPRHPGKLGQWERIELSIHSGSKWKTDRAIRPRMRLVATYDDASEKWYRVTEVIASLGEQADMIVKAESIASDLAHMRFAFGRSSTNLPARVLPLPGDTLQNQLTILFDSKNGIDPVFALGTVQTEIQSKVVDFNANFSSHQDIMFDLCRQADECEKEVRVSGGTVYLDFFEEEGWSAAERTAGTADPDSRLIEPPTSSSTKKNRLALKTVEKSADYFSRFIPIGDMSLRIAGPDASDANIGIRDLWWQVKTGGSGSGGTTQFTVENTINDGPIYIDAVYEGMSCYFTDDTINEVLTTDTDGNIEISGERTVVAGQWIKFVDVKSGAKTGTPATGDILCDIDYVYDPIAEGTAGLGVSEKEPVVMEGVAPYANLFRDYLFTFNPYYTDQPGSADLSDWNVSPDVPYGWAALNGATLTKTTDAAFVESGTACAKVEADTGEGITTSAMFFTSLPVLNRFLSTCVRARCTTGKARLTIEGYAFNPGEEGTFPPVWEKQADLVPGETLALSLGGMDRTADLPAGGYFITLTALEDGTVFYVNDLTFTNSLHAWMYSPDMGPRALYKAAAAHLIAEGGKLKTSYSARAFDISHIDPPQGQAEIVQGSHVRIRDFPDGAGGWLLDVTGRVVEIREPEDTTLGRFKKEIVIGEERKTIANSLVSRLAKARTDTAPLSPGDVITGVGLQIIDTEAEFLTADTTTDLYWSDRVRGGLFEHDDTAIGESDTAQAGTVNDITLAATANASDDYYNTLLIRIVSGTGVGQRRSASDYVGATKVLTVDVAFETAPDATSVYEIGADGGDTFISATGNLWRRVDGGISNPDRFAAAADGVTDDLVPVIDALKSNSIVQMLETPASYDIAVNSIRHAGINKRLWLGGGKITSAQSGTDRMLRFGDSDLVRVMGHHFDGAGSSSPAQPGFRFFDLIDGATRWGFFFNLFERIGDTAIVDTAEGGYFADPAVTDIKTSHVLVVGDWFDDVRTGFNNRGGTRASIVALNHFNRCFNAVKFDGENLGGVGVLFPTVAGSHLCLGNVIYDATEPSETSGSGAILQVEERVEDLLALGCIGSKITNVNAFRTSLGQTDLGFDRYATAYNVVSTISKGHFSRDEYFGQGDPNTTNAALTQNTTSFTSLVLAEGLKEARVDGDYIVVWASASKFQIFVLNGNHSQGATTLTVNSTTVRHDFSSGTDVYSIPQVVTDRSISDNIAAFCSRGMINVALHAPHVMRTLRIDGNIFSEWSRISVASETGGPFEGMRLLLNSLYSGVSISHNILRLIETRASYPDNTAFISVRADHENTHRDPILLADNSCLNETTGNAPDGDPTEDTSLLTLDNVDAVVVGGVYKKGVLAIRNSNVRFIGTEFEDVQVRLTVAASEGLVSITVATKTSVWEGNLADRLKPGISITISNTGDNDGTYTVSTFSYSGGNTTIVTTTMSGTDSGTDADAVIQWSHGSSNVLMETCRFRKVITRNSIAVVSDGGSLKLSGCDYSDYGAAPWTETSGTVTDEQEAVVFKAGDGSVTAPAFAFAGAAGKGLWRSGDDIYLSSSADSIAGLDDSVVAGLLIASSLAASVAKTSRLIGAHYNGTGRITQLYLNAPDPASNPVVLNIGGGTSAAYAVERMAFYAAANDTTLTGTKAFELVGDAFSRLRMLNSFVFSVVDGAVGAPGLCFESDTDTGIYKPADGELAIAVAGVQGLNVKSDHVDIPKNRGTAFPTTPPEGQQFYRTDLEEWFFYDSSRSKWLGLTLLSQQFGFAGATGAAAYINTVDGITMSSTLGFHCPFDVTVVGVTASRSDTNTGHIRIRDDGTNLTFLTFGTESKQSSMARNVDAASGSILSVYADFTSGVSDVIGTYFFRRHET